MTLRGSLILGDSEDADNHYGQANDALEQALSLAYRMDGSSIAHFTEIEDLTITTR